MKVKRQLFTMPVLPPARSVGRSFYLSVSVFLNDFQEFTFVKTKLLAYLHQNDANIFRFQILFQIIDALVCQRINHVLFGRVQSRQHRLRLEVYFLAFQKKGEKLKNPINSRFILDKGSSQNLYTTGHFLFLPRYKYI